MHSNKKRVRTAALTTGTEAWRRLLATFRR
jgi:hypothetical protein